MKSITTIVLFITLAAMAIMAVAIFLYWSDNALVITIYKYKSGKVNSDSGEIKITQVSDLHNKSFGKGQKKIINAVNKTNPDIIVLTGDAVDRNRTDYEKAMVAIRQLTKIAPVYYTNGNHEMILHHRHEMEIDDFYRNLQESGVNILFDTTNTITVKGTKITISGLAEETVFANKEEADIYDQNSIENKIEEITKSIDEKSLNILLSHEPQFLKEYDNKKIDLIFCGHAHGGQIRLPFTEGLFAPGQGILPKLTSGLHVYKSSTMVISRGLGNSIFPWRVFNRPEIVCLTVARQ